MTLKLTALALAALVAVDLVAAQTAAPAAPKAPEPDYTISYNIGATSDYRYRGISQSKLKPAIQGGIDYAHKNGFYLGAWASTIKWIKDAGAPTLNNVDTGASPVEIDLYGGYKFEAAKDLTLDFGGLQYYYPGNKYINIAGNSNANTFELYGALSYGIFTAKYSRSMTNLFGTGGSTTAALTSKGSGYLDLSATVDLGNGYSVVPHIGNQTVKNNTIYSYTDYSLTGNKDLGNGLVVSAAYVSTNAKFTPTTATAYAYPSPENRNLGKSAAVLSIKKSF
jgi:uncharacterized protein (TIGR02001 family)